MTESIFHMLILFMMDTDRPSAGQRAIKESCLETLNDFASQMEVATKEVCSALTKAADNMACFYDTH